MGQQATRLAITAAITKAELPLVGTVFPARDYIIEQDYEQNAALYYVANESGSSCVVVVNLPGPDKRRRIVLTGRGAVNDFNIHPIVLELFFASVGGEIIPAQLDYDSVVDSLTDFIRANPTMSAPDVVWSAGEYQAGVVHNASSPFTVSEGTTVFINGTVRFESWEQIVGNVVPIS